MFSISGARKLADTQDRRKPVCEDRLYFFIYHFIRLPSRPPFRVSKKDIFYPRVLEHKGRDFSSMRASVVPKYVLRAQGTPRIVGCFFKSVKKNKRGAYNRAH